MENNPSVVKMLKSIHLQPCHVQLLQLCLTLWDPMDCSPPGSLSAEIFRQEYWSELPFPPPEDLPNSGIETVSPVLQEGSLPLSHQHPELPRRH